MDIKLQEFIREIENLSQIRNSDARNPIAFDFDMPGMSMRFRVVGSIVEPTYQGYPINLIWVVMDGNSPYHRRALQLKSAAANDTEVEDRITDMNFLGTWVEVEGYKDLFLYPQYYVYTPGEGAGPGGPGPEGPKGDPGYILRGGYTPGTTYARRETVFFQGSSYSSDIDGNTGAPPGENWTLVAQRGDTPIIDYDRIIRTVIGMMRPVVTHIEISGIPASMYEGAQANARVIAHFNNGNTEDVTSACAYVVGPGTAGSVNAAGRFTAATNLSADVSASIRAVFTHEGAEFTTSASTNVRRILPASIAVTGAASVNEGASSNYSATVTYNNGTTATAPAEGRTWSVSNAAAGSINALGVFTAAQVEADLAASINVSYTARGVTVTGGRNITVRNVVIANRARFAAGPRVTNVAEFTSAFINALSGVVDRDGLSHSFDLLIPQIARPPLPGQVQQFGYYAHPKAWGMARFEEDSAKGFYGAWDGARNNVLDPSMYGPVEVQATVNGVTEAWYVYRTDQHSLGQTRWNIEKL